MAARKNRSVYQVKIAIRDIRPEIWRRLQILEDTALPRLHRVIQSLFNWEDYHLHCFEAGRHVYGVPDPDDAVYGQRVIDEKGVPIRRLLKRPGDTFDYLYDFGDGWQHEIVLEAIMLAQPDAFYPRCIDGARNGPPEDSGGPFGYAAYLEAISNPKHPEHRTMLNWRGRFDPEAFSLARINSSLKRSFDRRPKPPG